MASRNLDPSLGQFSLMKSGKAPDKKYHIAIAKVDGDSVLGAGFFYAVQTQFSETLDKNGNDQNGNNTAYNHVIGLSGGMSGKGDMNYDMSFGIVLGLESHKTYFTSIKDYEITDDDYIMDFQARFDFRANENYSDTGGLLYYANFSFARGGKDQQAFINGKSNNNFTEVRHMMLNIDLQAGLKENFSPVTLYMLTGLRYLRNSTTNTLPKSESSSGATEMFLPNFTLATELPVFTWLDLYAHVKKVFKRSSGDSESSNSSSSKGGFGDGTTSGKVGLAFHKNNLRFEVNADTQKLNSEGIGIESFKGFTTFTLQVNWNSGVKGRSMPVVEKVKKSNPVKVQKSDSSTGFDSNVDEKHKNLNKDKNNTFDFSN